MSSKPWASGISTSTPSYRPGLYVMNTFPVASTAGLAKPSFPRSSIGIAGRTCPDSVTGRTHPAPAEESRRRKTRTVPRAGCFRSLWSITLPWQPEFGGGSLGKATGVGVMVELLGDIGAAELADEVAI